jgi:predicted DCC family thiol-disulfide oxidoreductase YuxK
LQFGIKHLAWFPAHKAFQGLPTQVYGLERSDFEKSIWLIGRTAQFAGHKAAAWILLQQTNVFYRFVGAMILAGGPISAWAYRLVANNRHRLPGGTEACVVESLVTAGDKK